nr:MAG: hypothetical protein 3 [Macanavirus sp.]
MVCRCCDNAPTFSLFPLACILLLVLLIICVGQPHVQHTSQPTHNEHKTQYISIAGQS